MSDLFIMKIMLLMSVHHYFPLIVPEGIQASEHCKISSIMPLFAVFSPCPISTLFHPFRLMHHHSSGAMAPFCSFCFLLILSHAEGDHRTFNKVPLKYTEKSCFIFLSDQYRSCVCSIQQNENKLHSNHSQDIPGAVKELFTRPKAVWEENRHDSETREGRTEPDGLLWRGTAVNRRHCSLFGCLLAENGQKSYFTDDLRWDSIMIV